MRRIVLLVLLILAWPALTWAELVICFHPARVLGEQFSYRLSEDPSRVTDPQCTIIPAEGTATEDQRALFQRVPNKHLKVVGGLAVEMDATEKAAVDAAIAAREAAAKALKDELAQQGVCKFATLDEVNTELATRRTAKEGQLTTQRQNLQTQIDGINATTATTVRDQVKTVLTQMNTTRHQVDIDLLTEAYGLTRNVIRCEFARRGGRP